MSEKIKGNIVDLGTACGDVIKQHLSAESYTTMSAASITPACARIKQAFSTLDHPWLKGAGITPARGANVFIVRALAGSSEPIDYLRFLFERVFFDNFLEEGGFLLGQIPFIQLQLDGASDLTEDVHYEEEGEGSTKVTSKNLAYYFSYAQSDTPLLLIGETGTSKGLLSKAIHKMSKRRANSFSRINCASLPESLIESELFGSEKGAFTGATKTKEGLIKTADKGTLFLDELGKMPKHQQAKLLKVMEDKELYRVGCHTAIPVDVRFIAAIQPVDIENDSILTDLLYRLGYPDSIELPNLNVRLKNNTDTVIKACLQNISKRLNVDPPNINTIAIQLLTNHTYLGNFRELENILSAAWRSMTIRNSTTIQGGDLPFSVMKKVSAVESVAIPKNIKLKDIIEYADKMKKEIIEKKLSSVTKSEVDIRTLLKQEGMTEMKDYQNFLKKLRTITKKNLSAYIER